MQTPTLLVVLPVYNAAPYVRRAVDSILAQSRSDWAMVAIDDGSSDGSGEILDSYRDPRIQVWHQANAGLVASINRGFAHAARHNMPYVARMDADDISEPARFATQIALLDKQPQAAACSANCHYIDDEDNLVGASTVPISSRLIAWELRHNLRGMVHGATTFRTAALTSVGGCREPFRGAEDVDLFLRLSERYSLINAPEYLYRIRLNFRSLSVANARRNCLYGLYAIDCAARRRRRQPERSFAEYETAMGPWSRLQLQKELAVLDLWRRGMAGSRLAVLAAAFLSPRRIVARVWRWRERARTQAGPR